MPMKKSKIDQICEEVAYDLQLDKKLVKQVVQELFVEVASSLVFKKQHVLLRGFAKIVISGIAKSKYKSFNPMKYETRAEEEWKKPKTDE
jgi:nucleoid DNA-binding protein